MAGRFAFTSEEADEIRRLLRLKAQSDRDAQKGIRDKLRKLGFYITDSLSGSRPYTEADFEQDTRSGRLSIVD